MLYTNPVAVARAVARFIAIAIHGGPQARSQPKQPWVSYAALPQHAQRTQRRATTG